MKFTFFIGYIFLNLFFTRDLINNEVYIDEFGAVNNMYINNNTNATLKNIEIVFTAMDKDLISIKPIQIDSVGINKSKVIKPNVMLNDTWPKRIYMIDAHITSDNFEKHQIIMFRTNSKNKMFKWIGLFIACLTASLFFFIYKKYS